MVGSSERFLDKINTIGSYCDKPMLVETTSDSHKPALWLCHVCRTKILWKYFCEKQMSKFWPKLLRYQQFFTIISMDKCIVDANKQHKTILLILYSL